MSVYVDPMMACLPNKNWKYKQNCHMYADTETELHSFAKKLGLKRDWFQDNKNLQHYDLTANKRFQAVRLGAVEHTAFQMVDFMRGEKNAKQTSKKSR